MGFLVSISWLLVVILVLVDVITRDPSRIRHLDKTMWVIIVIIIPLIGSILWFAIGREWDQRADLGSFGDPRRAGAIRPAAATSTEHDLAAIEREIAFHEQQARIRRLEAALQTKRETR